MGGAGACSTGRGAGGGASAAAGALGGRGACPDVMRSEGNGAAGGGGAAGYAGPACPLAAPFDANFPDPSAARAFLPRRLM
jgi:hypothetical protein